MPDLRCYCDSELPEGAQLVLDAEESNHLVAANRGRQGDPVQVFNGRGVEARAILVEANKRAALLRLETRQVLPRPGAAVALAQALPKGKLMESIIAKATEIGIQSIYPLLAERVEVKLEGERKEAVKAAKWQSAAIEAAKQSGNAFLPEIAKARPATEFLSATPAFELKLIASLGSDARPLSEVFELFRSAHGGRSPESLCWLVGPEGDFTPTEMEQARAAGFEPVTLGGTVMRCETAATCAMILARYELDRSPSKDG